MAPDAPATEPRTEAPADPAAGPGVVLATSDGGQDEGGAAEAPYPAPAADPGVVLATGDGGVDEGVAAEDPRPGRGGWRRAASWLALLGLTALLLVITLATLVGRRPAAHVSAVTEQVEIDLDLAHGRTPNLVFSEGMVSTGGAVFQVSDASIVFHRATMVRLTRTSPDAIEIYLRASGGRVGNLFSDTRLERPLGSTASVRVPLRGSTVPASFYYSFHAERIRVGNGVRESNDQRLPLLRSGRVFIRDRSLFGVPFESGSRTLQLGDYLEVPDTSWTGAGLGTGFVRVEGSTGIVVRYVRANSNARVEDLNRKNDVVRTTATDRILNDPAVGLGWLVLLFFVIHPGASHLRDRLITLLTSRYHAMRVRSGSVRHVDRR
jgi:hypothetical protein